MNIRTKNCLFNRIIFLCILLTVVTCHATTTHSRSSINPVLLAPTMPKFYEKLQKEFDALRHSSSRTTEEKKRGVVSLSQAENIERAPTLYKFLNHAVEKLIKKTKLRMPTLFIYLNEDSMSYNASMHKTQYKTDLRYTSERGDRFSESIVHYTFNLTVGKELINLFFWNNPNKGCIKAVIAHEIGHQVNNHITKAVENEFEADTTAIKILKKPRDLPKAINMLTLAGHLYNNLAAIASDSLKEHVHFLIRVMTCSLIQEYPDLEKLGESASHTTLAFAVNAALEPILNPTATGNQPINAAQIVINAYNKLKQACVAPDQLLGKDAIMLTAQGILLDKLTHQAFPIYHPDPKSRKQNIMNRIAEIETVH